jgi:hypothetical protein
MVEQSVPEIEKSRPRSSESTLEDRDENADVQKETRQDEEHSIVVSADATTSEENVNTAAPLEKAVSQTPSQAQKLGKSKIVIVMLALCVCFFFFLFFSIIEESARLTMFL